MAYHKQWDYHLVFLKVLQYRNRLKTIYKNLHYNYGYDIPNHGDLTHWAEQGFLLLNGALSVRQNKVGSHSNEWDFLRTQL